MVNKNKKKELKKKRPLVPNVIFFSLFFLFVFMFFSSFWTEHSINKIKAYLIFKRKKNFFKQTWKKKRYDSGVQNKKIKKLKISNLFFLFNLKGRERREIKFKSPFYTRKKCCKKSHCDVSWDVLTNGNDRFSPSATFLLHPFELHHHLNQPCLIKNYQDEAPSEPITISYP